MNAKSQRQKRRWVLSPAQAARKRRVERWLRREQLTQVGLAATLGISTAYVSMILSGQRTPSLLIAKELSELTGIPATDFISS